MRVSSRIEDSRSQYQHEFKMAFYILRQRPLASDVVKRFGRCLAILMVKHSFVEARSPEKCALTDETAVHYKETGVGGMDGDRSAIFSTDSRSPPNVTAGEGLHWRLLRLQ